MLKLQNKIHIQYSWRRFLYMLCFFFLCVIDQRAKTCSGLDGWLETFRDLTGVVIAIIIISHFKLEDLKKRKKIYVTWLLVSIVVGIVVFILGASQRPFLNDWFVVVLDVVLFLFIMLHTFLKIVVDKEYPRLNVKYGCVWLAMMLWMIFSRSDYIWPFCYLIVFGGYYLLSLNERDQDTLFQGCLDGIILAFFILQGLCFVFRPYDIVRYNGMYHNPNLNALFYIEVLAAVLIKILYVTKNNCCKWIKIYYWLGAGTVLSFVFMTISRTGWLVAIAMVFFFLIFMNRMQLKKRLIKNGFIILTCTILVFPLCFGAVRYLPPVFHHPIWFWGEWSEGRVHSWDPWDSPKFLNLDDLLSVAFGRVVETVEEFFENSPLALTVSAEELDSKKEAMFSAEEELDGLQVRKTIYQYYFERLNLVGYPYEEQGFQLTPTYWIGHAHNIYLQYGTDFGVPVIVLFLVLIVGGIITCWRRYIESWLISDVASLYFIFIPAAFGLFEYSWGVGSFSITMMFIAWGRILINTKDSEL